MPYYGVVGLTPTNQEWIPAYLAEVTPLVAKYGGKYLARTTNHQRFEGNGQDHAVMVLIEWPSKESAESFYSDPAYQPHLTARQAGAETDFVLFESGDEFAE
jgi:uncharacterized protein (DUF1330 family)